MKNKKILFLLISTELGGAEQSLLDLIRYFVQERKESIHAIVPSEDGPLMEELKKLGVAFTANELPLLYKKTSRFNIKSILLFFIFGAPSYVRYFLKLKKQINSFQPDSIHSTGIKNHIALCFLTYFLKCNIIIHIRDYIRNPIFVWFFSCFKNRPNLYWISASDSVKSNLPFLVKTFYCGFKSSIYYKDKSLSVRTKLAIPSDVPLIGILGVLARWKGQVEFISAAAEVLKTHPQCHFIVVGSQIYKTSGDQNYKGSLIKLRDSLGLKQNVHFLEFQKNANEVYNNLDILVHCSTSPEPFGRVIVEGMLCQVPIIAADAGGAKEIVINSSVGLLHEPKNIKDLTEKIIYLLDNKEANSKVQNAYVWATQKFEYTSCFRKMTDYICSPHRD
jgi:glycosyltransferase involved in cell wall biosynthesis